jgi:hypothetical protein
MAHLGCLKAAAVYAQFAASEIAQELTRHLSLNFELIKWRDLDNWRGSRLLGLLVRIRVVWVFQIVTVLTVYLLTARMA